MQIISYETICMKYQAWISEKNKKNISKRRLLKILLSMLRINVLVICLARLNSFKPCPAD